jgi:tyrosyl-tRNA synthetase
MIPLKLGVVLDNASWLVGSDHIGFLRETGRRFSVNRMLQASAYRSRRETGGLSFLDFNYMTLQAYDYLKLYKDYGARLQIGGKDQWGNILAGIDLVKRETGGTAYGLTTILLSDPGSSEKFGNHNKRTLWLSPHRTSDFEYYQYWRDSRDEDLPRLLSLFTFLPEKEIDYLCSLPGKLINRAKEILAYECVRFARGKDAAEKAYINSLRFFSPADPEGEVKSSSPISSLKTPTASLKSPISSLKDPPFEGEGPRALPFKGGDTIDLTLSIPRAFVLSGLASSLSMARRLIRQGGAYVEDLKIDPDKETASLSELKLSGRDFITLRVGKKRYKKISLSGGSSPSGEGNEGEPCDIGAVYKPEEKTPKTPIRPWSFVSDQELLKTPVFTVLSRKVISPKDGKEKSFSVLEARDWVNILALTPDNMVVLVNQYRHGSREFSLELPGGVTDPGDSLAEGAKRELMEETGYSVGPISELVSFYPNPALLGNRITTFLAKGAIKTGGTDFDENEETEVLLLSLPEIKERFLAGEFEHALMGAAIGYFLVKEGL